MVNLDDFPVVAYRPIFTKITGSVKAGLLLSQIVYWFSANEDGQTKLRVRSKGRLGLTKSWRDWHDELGFSKYESDQAIARLGELGIIEVSNINFAGRHQRFIVLNETRLENLIRQTTHDETKTDGMIFKPDLLDGEDKKLWEKALSEAMGDFVVARKIFAFSRAEAKLAKTKKREAQHVAE